MSHWYRGLPSVTTILDVRSKPGLDHWKRRVGFDEADRRSLEATDLGTRVHEIIQKHIQENQKPILSPLDPARPYYEGFLNWLDKYQPTDLEAEVEVRSEEHGYAGTLDLRCKINGEDWIVDWKTSKRIDPGMGLQLIAYERANLPYLPSRMGIVQLTPELKRGFRFQEFDEDFEVFLAHKRIFDWLRHTGQIEPPIQEGIISR